MSDTGIDTLFLDIGGVLLTNGWDRHARKRAAEKFGLDLDEVNERHHLTFDTYEEGKLDLAEYLSRVVFNEKRSFTYQDFKNFMFHQSKPLPGAIDFFLKIKFDFKLKVVAVSNEGRELTEHRIEKFELRRLFDMFISSCFLHFRKPDKDLYRMALHISQAVPEKALYIDDRSMFVEVARSMGIQGIYHLNLESTQQRLSEMGVL